jgi:hypothetical protein
VPKVKVRSDERRRKESDMAHELVKGRRSRGQRGMTTAEYAVGTVATVSFVGVILAIIGNPEFQNALWKLIAVIISTVVKAMGAA